RTRAGGIGWLGRGGWRRGTRGGPVIGSPVGRGARPRYQRGRMRESIRILGIDPGLRRTGWGIIDVAGNRLLFVACGSVETSERTPLSARLVTLPDGPAQVVQQILPHAAPGDTTI